MHFTIQLFHFGYDLCLYRPDYDVLLVTKLTLCKFLLLRYANPTQWSVLLSFNSFNVLCVVPVNSTV